MSNWQQRITSERITHVEVGQVFVFGANLAMINGAGAAKFAMKIGAQYGKTGLVGQTYALPTKPHNLSVSLPLSAIAWHVAAFLACAYQHPELTFLVTEVGCGLAGYQPEQIAPLFVHAIDLPNVHLPARFWQVLAPHL
jgi:hypothetical protein